MISETRGVRLLEGHRGSPPYDIDALAETISLVSRVAWANAEQLAEVEINPLRLLPAGEGAIALDALVVPASDTGAAPGGAEL